MAIKCEKCGSTNITVRLDKRGLPEAVCSDCGSYIKKMGAAEVAEFYMTYLDNTPTAHDVEQPEEKMQCRYCTEEWSMKLKVPGLNREVYQKMDITHCPMCGRKLTGNERNY